MKPTNQKNLYHLLFDALERVNTGELKVPNAREMSNLAARINTAVKLEHDRARVKMELEMHKRTTGSNIELREIEGKNFD